MIYHTPYILTPLLATPRILTPLLVSAILINKKFKKGLSHIPFDVSYTMVTYPSPGFYSINK